MKNRNAFVPIPEKINLHEFLNYFDFDYEVIPYDETDKYELNLRKEKLEDGEFTESELHENMFSFVDMQGAYLGEIDRERYLIRDDLVENIFERLDVYINDSVYEEFYSELHNRGIHPDYMTLEEMWLKAKELNLTDGEVCYALAAHIIHPQTILVDELERDKRNIDHAKELNNMKHYSVAQLKRDAKEGIISAVMTVRNGESIPQDALPERMQGKRKIINSNTTSLMFENPVEPSKPSYITLPKANLIEYTDTHLRIYFPGYREPNEAEQKILDEWKAIEARGDYQKQLEIDCLTDGSVTYYQQLGFFRSHDMEYLMGTVKQRGLRLDFNKRNAGEKAFIQDENIKGDISLEYQIERVKTLENPSFHQQVQAAAEKTQVNATRNKQPSLPER